MQDYEQKMSLYEYESLLVHWFTEQTEKMIAEFRRIGGHDIVTPYVFDVSKKYMYTNLIISVM